MDLIIKPINEPLKEQKVKYHEIVFPHGAHCAIITENEIVVFGTTSSNDEDGYDENLAHNCDQMGCGNDHILLRVKLNLLAWYVDEERKVKVIYE